MGRRVTLTERSEGRDNNFDFLRFLLAVFVLFYHCYPILYGFNAPHHGLAETVADICGGVAVPFFFVISGFLVTRSWRTDPRPFDYLQKRVLRIYPGFLAASLFCALVVGPLGAADLAAYWHGFQPVKFARWALLLVGPFIPPIFVSLPMSTGVNGSFWTLRYEGYCYLLVLALGLAGLFRRRGALLAVFLVLYALRETQTLTGRVFFPDRELHLFGNISYWSSLILYFLAGMLFFLYRDAVPYSRAVFLACLGALLFCALVLGHLEVGLPVYGSYVLLCLAFWRRLRLHRFARYGDFSYGLYLYAFPIQQLLVLYYGQHLTIATLFGAAFLLALCLAVLSWYGVERPCLRLKRRSSRDPATRPEIVLPS